jgi:hypothetical protein
MDDPVIPSTANDSWRAWLMTGIRRGPVARRRVRGAHKGLKKILVEGTLNGDEHPHPWKDFSGVMVRQAVDEAVSTLPQQQKEVVKLAYFAGLSNQEIGDRLGLTVGGVERRLRQALASVSEYIERGRSVGRRAVFGLAFLLSGRFFIEAARRQPSPSVDRVMQAAVVMGAGAAAAGLLALHPASTAQLNTIERGGVPARTTAQPDVVVPGADAGVQRTGLPVPASLVQAGSAGGRIYQVPNLPSLPGAIKVKLSPVKVSLPTLPPLPQLPPLPRLAPPPPLPPLPHVL